MLDDFQAKKTGQWQAGANLDGFVGKQYLYSAASEENKIQFEVPINKDGKYDVRISWRPHENRATNVPIKVTTSKNEQDFTINMKNPPTIKGTFESLDVYELEKGSKVTITVATNGIDGFACVDAVQLLPVNK